MPDDAVEPTASDLGRALVARRWRRLSADERRAATAPGRAALEVARARRKEQAAQAAAQ